MKKIFEGLKNYCSKISKNTKDIVNVFLTICMVFVFCLALIWMYRMTFPNRTPKYSPMHVQKCMYTLKYDASRYELVNEIDTYIKSVAPQSSLDGYAIMEECLNNDIDICFVLAQGEQESHFGTTGLARKTNSVFNVYAFDGKSHDEISEKGKYKHPNHSVAPYIELLKKDYLVKGRTEYDLMDSAYVNKHGKRYASAENYEKALLAKYMKIRQSTKIDSLCQETNKYKMFLGLD